MATAVVALLAEVTTADVSWAFGDPHGSTTTDQIPSVTGQELNRADTVYRLRGALQPLGTLATAAVFIGLAGRERPLMRVDRAELLARCGHTRLRPLRFGRLARSRTAPRDTHTGIIFHE